MTPRRRKKPSGKTRTIAKRSPKRSPSQPLSSGSNNHAEDQFRLMIEAVTDYAIYMLDPEGRIVTWNPGAKRLKGYLASEVIGRSFSMFFTETAVREGQPGKELEQAKARGRFEEEGWRVRKHGPPFWANVVLTPVYDADRGLRGFVKVTKDLTERRHAEDALRQSEQWLMTVLRSIGDGVIATDAAGDVKFMNPVAEHLTGWAHHQAIKMPLDKVFVIVNEQTRDPVPSPFFKVVSTGGVVGLANHTVLIARDGKECPIKDSGAPILDAKGNIQGVVIVFRKGEE